MFQNQALSDISTGNEPIQGQRSDSLETGKMTSLRLLAPDILGEIVEHMDFDTYARLFSVLDRNVQRNLALKSVRTPLVVNMNSLQFNWTHLYLLKSVPGLSGLILTEDSRWLVEDRHLAKLPFFSRVTHLTCYFLLNFENRIWPTSFSGLKELVFPRREVTGELRSAYHFPPRLPAYLLQLHYHPQISTTQLGSDADHQQTFFGRFPTTLCELTLRFNNDCSVHLPTLFRALPVLQLLTLLGCSFWGEKCALPPTLTALHTSTLDVLHHIEGIISQLTSFSVTSSVTATPSAFKVQTVAEEKEISLDRLLPPSLTYLHLKPLSNGVHLLPSNITTFSVHCKVVKGLFQSIIPSLSRVSTLTIDTASLPLEKFSTTLPNSLTKLELNLTESVLAKTLENCFHNDDRLPSLLHRLSLKTTTFANLVDLATRFPSCAIKVKEPIIMEKKDVASAFLNLRSELASQLDFEAVLNCIRKGALGGAPVSAAICLCEKCVSIWPFQQLHIRSFVVPVARDSGNVLARYGGLEFLINSPNRSHLAKHCIKASFPELERLTFRATQSPPVAAKPIVESFSRITKPMTKTAPQEKNEARLKNLARLLVPSSKLTQLDFGIVPFRSHSEFWNSVPNTVTSLRSIYRETELTAQHEEFPIRQLAVLDTPYIPYRLPQLTSLCSKEHLHTLRVTLEATDCALFELCGPTSEDSGARRTYPSLEVLHIRAIVLVSGSIMLTYPPKLTTGLMKQESQELLQTLEGLEVVDLQLSSVGYVHARARHADLEPAWYKTIYYNNAQLVHLHVGILWNTADPPLLPTTLTSLELFTQPLASGSLPIPKWPPHLKQLKLYSIEYRCWSIFDLPSTLETVALRNLRIWLLKTPPPMGAATKRYKEPQDGDESLEELPDLPLLQTFQIDSLLDLEAGRLREMLPASTQIQATEVCFTGRWLPLRAPNEPASTYFDWYTAIQSSMDRASESNMVVSQWDISAESELRYPKRIIKTLRHGIDFASDTYLLSNHLNLVRELFCVLTMSLSPIPIPETVEKLIYSFKRDIVNWTAGMIDVATRLPLLKGRDLFFDLLESPNNPLPKKLNIKYLKLEPSNLSATSTLNCARLPPNLTTLELSVTQYATQSSRTIKVSNIDALPHLRVILLGPTISITTPATERLKIVSWRDRRQRSLDTTDSEAYND